MPKPSTHGGKRKGSGRVQQFGPAQTVRLTPEQIRIAEQLGGGKVGAGIRASLDLAGKMNLEKFWKIIPK